MKSVWSDNDTAYTYNNIRVQVYSNKYIKYLNKWNAQIKLIMFTFMKQLIWIIIIVYTIFYFCYFIKIIKFHLSKLLIKLLFQIMF